MRDILVIATGGTIASVEGEDGSLAPALTGDELVAHVPQLADLANIHVHQLMNIDSTNMDPAGWLRIAAEIERTWDSFDGFVVLHGTDTMAYTAAALSYLVQASPKPIVLTGSQQPMGAPFTDAKLNLYSSVLWAADELASDVHVVFGGQIIVGTRARKQRTLSSNAFTSVNWPLPAIVRGGRIVRDAGPGMLLGSAVRGQGRPHFYHMLDERVVALRLTPGLSPAALAYLASGVSAVVLETFGVGGIPDALTRTVLSLADEGVTLVLTTQVPEEGLDLGIYEVGRPFADHPQILRGADMTLEAIVAKVMWAKTTARDEAELAELFTTPINHDRAL